jgi:hypothetical protein
MRDLPLDFRTDDDFIRLIQANDAPAIVAYLEMKEREADEEERDFVAEHPEPARLSHGDSRSLSSDDRAQVEWYQGELERLGTVTRALRRGVRFAKDVAGIEAHFPAEPD